MLKKLLSYLYPISIYKTQSVYNQCIEVVLYNGKLLLDTQKVNYSNGALKQVMDFGLHKIGVSQIKSSQNILVLGVAGGSVLDLLYHKYQYTGQVIGVEIDAEIIRVAKEYFQLDNYPNTHILSEDAYQFEPKVNQAFDLIIVDLFIEDTIDPKLFTKVFQIKLNSWLNNHGKILINTIITTQEDQKRNDLFFNQMQQMTNIVRYSKVVGCNELFIISKCVKI